MKSWILLAAAGAIGTPIAVQAGVEMFDPSALEMDEDSDLWMKAQEIAKRDFGASAALTVLSIELRDVRIGQWGEKIEPDHGYRFHVVKLKFENTGKVDLAVSAWHFSGIDEWGSDHAPEGGNAHEDFDASRLGKGHVRVGTLIYELYEDSRLTEIVWSGDLASATTRIS